jgi:phage FluMu protein Com
MPDWIHYESILKNESKKPEEALERLKAAIRERKCYKCRHLIQDVSQDEEFTCAIMHSNQHEPQRGLHAWAFGIDSSGGHGYLAIREPKKFGCTMWETNK